MVLMTLMIVLAIGAIKLTSLNTEMAGAHKKSKQAFYSAETGLDIAVNDIIQEFENLSV